MGLRHSLLLLALAAAGAAARPLSLGGDLRGDLVRVDFYMEALWQVPASAIRRLELLLPPTRCTQHALCWRPA
jgi:hypothetical protein